MKTAFTTAVTGRAASQLDRPRSQAAACSLSIRLLTCSWKSLQYLPVFCTAWTSHAHWVYCHSGLESKFYTVEMTWKVQSSSLFFFLSAVRSFFGTPWNLGLCIWDCAYQDGKQIETNVHIDIYNTAVSLPPQRKTAGLLCNCSSQRDRDWSINSNFAVLNRPSAV